ncbi:GtrA family protein [Lysinibacillus fusiformis]|uniref:Polysaccharide synthesis protein GtrA n=2 Tax=Bacillaceae TaxID=186817 RepID=A0A1E4R2X1_9BACI|nr:GtrA family protein [Lysinibacillus fusiformis]ODV54797.1 polysaccharide synthesis protein GtrA [Lysinibacillus fusiformis]
MKCMNKEFIRFLCVGGFNTVATYCVYLTLLSYIGYNFAYVISYISGIVISFLLNAKYVFNVKLTFKKAIGYPIVYIVQYIINVIVLNLLVKNNIVNEVMAPILVIVISIPLTFILSKYILKK